jgi:hypothetical protein
MYLLLLQNAGAVAGTVVMGTMIKVLEEGEAELTQKELLNFIKDILIGMLWETLKILRISGKQIRRPLIDVPRTQVCLVLVRVGESEDLPQIVKVMFVIVGGMAVMGTMDMVLEEGEAERREMLIKVVQGEMEHFWLVDLGGLAE